MGYRQTMKIGFIGFIYTPPEEITDVLEGVFWQIDRAAALGCSVFQPAVPLPTDRGSLEKLKAKIDEKGVELEIQAPRAVFELAGPDKAAARKEVEEWIDIAKFLGSKIMRNGYGTLNTSTSRFNKEISIQEHLDFLARNLTEAARIYEDHGLYYAIENHCDFTGREFVQVFETVDSSHVGSALDTANGFTVYCDPNDDVDALAPYAITTHIKDMKVVDHASELIPFQARGCVLGEGDVDIPRALDLLETYSPRAEGLHLVVEQGWFAYEPGKDSKAQDKAALEESLVYLKKLIA